MYVMCGIGGGVGGAVSRRQTLHLDKSKEPQLVILEGIYQQLD